MKTLTDTDIIESIKRGNYNDYSLLISRYKDRAYSLLNSMLKNRFDSEEALQDSFLKAFNSLGEFKAQSKFSTWFYRIVYNTGLTFLQSKRRRIDNETDSLEMQEDIRSEEFYSVAEDDDIKVFIHDAVKRLPARYCTIINLFYIDGLSLEEISKVTGLTVANIKVLLHRSRLALKEMLVREKVAEELR